MSADPAPAGGRYDMGASQRPRPARDPRPTQEESAVETWRDRFNRWANRATIALGSAAAVILSVLVVVVWALTGPFFNYSDSWQLVINTATTVITFWMVFVIQNSQNRDARAIHLKLDEIIRANETARNEFIVAEKATEAQLEAHENELHDLVDQEPTVDGLEAAKPEGPDTRRAAPDTRRAANDDAH